MRGYYIVASITTIIGHTAPNLSVGDKMSLRFLNSVSDDDLKEILESVDAVFLDVDGVMVLAGSPITDSGQCVMKFRQLNKKIDFVTNNVFNSKDLLRRNLAHSEANLDEITTPNDVALRILKKKNLSGDVFMIGSRLLRRLLTEAGYNVIEYKDIQKEPLTENFSDLVKMLKKALIVCANVKAVIVTMDFEYSHQSAQIVTTLLQRFPDILFLSATHDDTGPLGENFMFTGYKYIVDAIKRWSDKPCIDLAKPSTELCDALLEKHGMTDKSKILFIGDNLTTDIFFAKMSQFKTLLVLSGITTRSEIEDPLLPESHRPDYVADSLTEVFERIKDF